MVNAPAPLKILVVMAADPVREPWARTKYGGLLRALGSRFELAGVVDVSLRGAARWANALRVFSPRPQRWRQRFYTNDAGFRGRSRVAARLLARLPPVDCVLQVGVSFDALGALRGVPGVVYTDYTAALAALHPELGRTPFDAGGRSRWLALERACLQRAAHVLAWSATARASLLADCGLEPSVVTVVGGGVNLHPLPAPAPRGPARPPTVLFIGKDFLRKGGDRLLRSFARLRARRPDARLIMLTRGPIPAGLPLGGVEVVAPTWDRDAIAALYRRADCFALPSRLETWGDVFLEAMAFALPCVAVEGTPPAEIVVDGETGLLVPRDPDDEDALAEALDRMLGDAGLRERLGAAGRRRVEREFAWERVAERMEPALRAAARA